MPNTTPGLRADEREARDRFTAWHSNWLLRKPVHMSREAETSEAFMAGVEAAQLMARAALTPQPATSEEREALIQRLRAAVQAQQAKGGGG